MMGPRKMYPFSSIAIFGRMDVVFFAWQKTHLAVQASISPKNLYDAKSPEVYRQNGCTKAVYFHISQEKNPGWLGYIGDYTTQLYGDYNKPL